MDYNQLITEELPEIIKSTLKLVDTFSDYYKIDDIKVTIEDSDVQDLGTYVSTGTTCEFTAIVDYKLNVESEYRTIYISVPRMINGVFIINGKYKMLTRYLGEDHVCRWWGSFFKFHYGLTYNEYKEVFECRDENGEMHECDTWNQVEDEFPEQLDMTEHESEKWKIKLNLNYYPKKETYELVRRIKEISRDTTDIIDKKIKSIEWILLNSLRNNRLNIAKELQHNFYNKGTLSSAPFSKIIRSVFNGQGNNLDGIANTTNINPLSFDSVNSKIIIEHGNMDETTMPGQYSWSMADIIDPVVTPDNANINRINHLNKAAGIVRGQITIHCYDKDFKAVEVNYVKYLSSKVLQYTEVKSYHKHEVLKKDLYKIKENRKETLSSTYDYIEPEPDDKLCSEARMIPMLNLSDSVRGSMGAKMITQAIPLAHPDTPRVMSGHETDYSQSTTDVRYLGDKSGVVTHVDQESVIVTVDDIPHEYKVPKPAIGIYDITAVFSPTVKEGDKVNRGDIIISEDISKSGTRNLGVNALVELRPYRGYNYEDGIVISESFAKRVAHYSILDVQINVKDNESIVSMLPIGSLVKSRDKLVELATRVKSESLKTLISTVNPNEELLVQTNNLLCPNNVDYGIITDVKIQYDDYATYRYKDQINKLDENSVKIIEKFKQTPTILPDSIPAAYRAKIPGTVEYDGYAAAIRYRILVSNPAIPGCKLTNRYGGKGLISIVVPDSEMDRTEDGREIDVILNSDAVIARKNISQIPEVYLSMIADKVKQICNENLENNLTLDSIRTTLNTYKLDNYSELSDEDLTIAIKSDKPFNYITGCFSRITPKEVLAWMDNLKINPRTRIIDGKTHRKVKNPILVGSMYMMKLMELPQYTNKIFTPDVSEDPILGNGLAREEEGMRQGNLETFALLASDLEPMVHATRKKTSFTDAQGILINLRLAGVDLEIQNDNKDKLNSK